MHFQGVSWFTCVITRKTPSFERKMVDESIHVHVDKLHCLENQKCSKYHNFN